MSDLPEIYFLHIPKTAGSTLASLIRGAYPQEAVIPVFEFYELVLLPREQINRYQCFSGHFGTGLFSLLDRPIPTVTVLRDPVERAISAILYAERDEHSNRVRLAARTIRSLSELDLPILSTFIEKSCLIPFLHEFQTRYLGLEIDLNPYLGKTIKTVQGLSYVLNKNEKRQSMEQAFERAKQCLNECVVVGTVERFGETVEDVCHYLNIDVPANTPRLNANLARSTKESYRDSGKVAKRFVKLLDEITEYDRELYAYANRLMDSRQAQKNRPVTQENSLGS